MAVPFLDSLMKNLPAIVIVTAMSAILFKYVWKEKKKKKCFFNERAVFVTGCDSVTGFEIAKRLDKLGFYVFAGCLKPEGDGALRLKSRTSSKLKVVGIDIRKDEDVKKAVEYVRTNLPFGVSGLYCLINNVTTILHGDFDWYTTSQCQKLMDTNVMGTFRVTKYFLPLLKPIPGRIINITGISGRFTYPQLSVYIASKWALEAFATCLRYEMVKFRIPVSIIEQEDCTRFTIKFMPKEDMDEMWENMDGENKEFYAEEFHQWKHLVEDYSKHSSKTEKDLFKHEMDVIEEAVIEEYPKNRYVIVSASFKLLFYFLSFLPDSYKDKAIKLLGN